MIKENSEALLRCMADVLNQNAYRAEILESEQVPMLLRCEAQRQGKVAKDVAIECSFVSLPLPAEETGLLQFFVTLFPNVPDIYVPHIRRACEYCNQFCALGAFGFFMDEGILYLKHNTLIDGSLTLAQNVPLIADSISLLLASVSKFIDGLASVAFTGTPLEAAIDQELFPKR